MISIFRILAFYGRSNKLNKFAKWCLKIKQIKKKIFFLRVERALSGTDGQYKAGIPLDFFDTS